MQGTSDLLDPDPFLSLPILLPVPYFVDLDRPPRIQTSQTGHVLWFLRGLSGTAQCIGYRDRPTMSSKHQSKCISDLLLINIPFRVSHHHPRTTSDLFKPIFESSSIALTSRVKISSPCFCEPMLASLSSSFRRTTNSSMSIASLRQV